jgi:hypothetical protein
MSKLSRTKGLAFERECAAILNTIPGATAERNLTETRDGNSGDLVNNLGYAIQCKIGAAPPIWTGLAEAVAASKGAVPVLMASRNRAKGRPRTDIVVMRRDDWITLVTHARAA